MVKMDLKFIKTSNRSSFLSIKLLFSGFQISFPMFLNNLLCKSLYFLQLTVNIKRRFKIIFLFFLMISVLIICPLGIYLIKNG